MATPSVHVNHLHPRLDPPFLASHCIIHCPIPCCRPHGGGGVAARPVSGARVALLPGGHVCGTRIVRPCARTAPGTCGGGGRGVTLLYCTSSHQVCMCVCGSGAGGGGATCACALTWPICLALIKQQKVGSSPFFHLSLPPLHPHHPASSLAPWCMPSGFRCLTDHCFPPPPLHAVGRPGLRTAGSGALVPRQVRPILPLPSDIPCG